MPCQRVPVFLAVHVPSATRSSPLTSVHQPSAKFGLSREISEPHDPRNVCADPTDAVHVPRSSDVSCARALCVPYANTNETINSTQLIRVSLRVAFIVRGMILRDTARAAARHWPLAAPLSKPSFSLNARALVAALSPADQLSDYAVTRSNGGLKS